MEELLFGKLVRYFDADRGRQWPAIVTSEYELNRVDLTAFTDGPQLFRCRVEEGAEPGQWSPLNADGIAEAERDRRLEHVVALIWTLAPDERSRLNVTVPGFIDALKKVVGGDNVERFERFEPVLKIREAATAIREGQGERAAEILDALAPELDRWSEALVRRLEAAERAAR